MSKKFKFGSKIDAQKRTSMFIREVLEDRKVYYMYIEAENRQEFSESHDYVSHQGEPLPVLMFWSKTYIPYAKSWVSDGQLREMSLKKFKRYLLDGLIPPDIIVGINWDQNGGGEEIHPVELLSALVKPKWYKEYLKKIIKPLHTWLYT